MHEVVAVVHWKLPGVEVTLYEVMAEPPLDAGAVHDTTEEALAFEVAVTPVGAPGAVAGVAVGEGVEAEPVPLMFVAVTVNV